MVAAIGLALRHHVGRCGGTNDAGAQVLGPLHPDLAHAAGRGMKDDGLARLHRMDPAQQILRRHALQQHGGSNLVADAVRNLHQPRRRDVHRLGIGADEAAGIADPVTGLEGGDAVADGLHHAGGFRAQARRQRQGVEPGAVIGVNEVHTDGGVLHPHFAGRGRRQLHIHILQHIAAAGLFKTDGLGHVTVPSVGKLAVSNWRR